MQNEEYCAFLETLKQEQIPVVLTAAEAMDVLNVGKNTMYRMLNSGALPAVRIGRSWRIEMSAIQYILKSN